MPDCKQRGDVSEDTSPFFLSPRQVAVLGFAAQGLTTVGTANELGIAERTVRKHLRKARGHLQAENTTHAVAIAITKGFIRL